MNLDIENLQRAIDWLETVIDGALGAHFGDQESFNVKPLDFYEADSGLPLFIQTHQPSFEEFGVLMLALIPHCRPGWFEHIIGRHCPNGGDFPELGGIRDSRQRGFLPTGETAQFILAGSDLEKRLTLQQMFGGEHWFARQRILWLGNVPEGEPMMSGPFVLNPELVEHLTLGTISKPRFSSDFPAEALETQQSWDDLVLNANTRRQIEEIQHWISHHQTLLHDWGMSKQIKPGYRALFYGPPGTGKTLTASLLGKYTNKPVYRVDLSRVVSKYIGETEKNLARLFDKAEHKSWILFFDEADALFGKRTDIRDAHDKYANQEIAYLLQRIETYNGLVILASNQRSNIDEAFVRRFHSIIHFPMPRSEEREQLWRNTLPPQIVIANDIDLHDIAARFELSGAAIVNIVHYSAIELLAAQNRQLDLKQLEKAIHRELVKEGKIV